MPARDQWWDDVIRSDTAHCYQTADQARKDDGSGRTPARGRKLTFIWGDRVRVVKREPDVARISGRGVEYWVNGRHLGGKPLLGQRKGFFGKPFIFGMLDTIPNRQ